ncbi:MAG: cyclase family protein [Clostridiales bacterium]|nr:cyclase family protein [Clostridiales bacterium]
MKIYDISQEIPTCEVYPGDPAPEITPLKRIAEGGTSNLSAFSMCAHNGTHVDAPFHFYADGRTIGEMPPEYFVGLVYVAECRGDISAADAKGILDKAQDAERILIKGDAVISIEAAKVFAKADLKLLGNESQTVGSEKNHMEIHKILLGAGMTIMEGARLYNVPEGKYFLNAMPINLGAIDGAPCRAVLIEFE